MEMDLRSVPQTDPVDIYRYRDGLYAADFLGAALVYFDFFTWLEGHPGSLEEICTGLGIQKRPTDVMLTLFTAMGLVQGEGGRFTLTLKGKEHLTKGSPWYIAPYYASLKDRPVCKDFVEVLKTGKPANWGSFKDEKDWTRAMEDPVFAEGFTAAMDCRGVYLAQAAAKKVDLSGRKKVLDVAGGSGIYACAVAAHNEHISAAVFEKRPVDKVAERAIAKRGFSERVKVIAGDMFKEELPGGFDAHLISNVLHDWDEPAVRELLAKSHRALPRGGMLIIHDAMINREKTGPLPVAAYSALLMHATEGKCYSVGEYEEMLEALGFEGMRHVETAADRSVLMAEKCEM